MNGMNGMIDIVIIALIACFVLLRLRSVLGRKGGAERPRQMEERLPHDDPFAPPPPPKEQYRDIPADKPEPAVPAGPPVNVAPLAEPAIADIGARDGSFDLAKFMDGARSAYEMILAGFWRGDAAAIRPYLSDEVHESFASAITARDAEGLKVENRLLAIDDAAVSDAKIQGDSAEITVKFTADIVAVTRNAEGRVVEGNMSDAVVTTDVWTFRRALGSRDPNWTLVATRAG